MSKSTNQPDNAQAISVLYCTVIDSIWRMDSSIRGRNEIGFEENDSVYKILSEAGEEAANIGMQAMSDMEGLLRETLGIDVVKLGAVSNCFEQYRDQMRASHYKQVV